MGDLEYVYIGRRILQFIAKSKIIEFHSVVGARFNIYPWALDDQGNVYITDISIYMKCTKEEIENFDDYVLSELVYFSSLKSNSTNYNHAPIQERKKRCKDFVEIAQKKEILFKKKAHPHLLDNDYFSLKSKNIHPSIEIFEDNLSNSDHTTCLCYLKQ